MPIEVSKRRTTFSRSESLREVAAAAATLLVAGGGGGKGEVGCGAGGWQFLSAPRCRRQAASWRRKFAPFVEIFFPQRVHKAVGTRGLALEPEEAGERVGWGVVEGLLQSTESGVAGAGGVGQVMGVSDGEGDLEAARPVRVTCMRASGLEAGAVAS